MRYDCKAWKYVFEDGEELYSFRRLGTMFGRAIEYEVELKVVNSKLTDKELEALEKGLKQ